MVSLITSLFNVFAPVILDMVKAHQAANGGEVPTQEQLKAQFTADIHAKAAAIIAEGNAWKAAHP